MSRSSVQEFVELLAAEQYVPLDKVREVARHGVPAEIRGEVWMYLLGVLLVDKTSELTTARSRLQTYSLIPKKHDIGRIASSSAHRYHTRTFGLKSLPQLVHDATFSSDLGPPWSVAASQVDGSSSSQLRTTRMDTSELPDEDRDDEDPLSSTSIYPASKTLSFHVSPSSPTIFPMSNDPLSPPPIANFTSSIKNIICAYANSNPSVLAGVDDASARRDIVDGWVETLGPFVGCLRLEAGIFWGWGAFQAKKDQHFAEHPLPHRLASFLSLLRSTLPDLYNWFEEEEVPIIEIASSWLDSLFSREMNLQDVSRLWDTYFSHPDPFSLHQYVCLSVLATCNDILEELDQSEARAMLLRLPRLDIDRILHDAQNYRVHQTSKNAMP